MIRTAAGTAGLLTCLGSGGAIIAQSIAPVPEAITLVNQLKDIGLIGALMLGLVALWRLVAKKDGDIASKDAQLIQNSKLVVEALTLAAGAQQQLAASNKDLQGAIDKLRESVNVLPCTLVEGQNPRHR